MHVKLLNNPGPRMCQNKRKVIEKGREMSNCALIQETQIKAVPASADEVVD